MTPQPAPSARRLLGKGLALVAVEDDRTALDVDLLVRDGRRDLAVVAGNAMLLQDLQVALCTGLGTDPLNRGFGSDAFAAIAEETDPVMMRERIRVAVIRLLRADPRVRRVVEVRLNGEPRPFSTERTTSLKTLEWERINEVLAETGFNISETARRLGMHRRTLARKLEKRHVT